jgi:hypothetical protein
MPHTVPPVTGALPNTPTPGVTALSVFVIVAGILMGGLAVIYQDVVPGGAARLMGGA